MKKFILYLLYFLITSESNNKKGKKGDFSFRKCSQCGLNNNDTY